MLSELVPHCLTSVATVMRPCCFSYRASRRFAGGYTDLGQVLLSLGYKGEDGRRLHPVSLTSGLRRCLVESDTLKRNWDILVKAQLASNIPTVLTR